LLRVSELVEVARTLDDDGSSRYARQAARAWGGEHVRFVRSSANHVFVCGDGIVLRFRPHEPDAIECAERIAALTERLAEAGAPVADAVRSLDGRLVVSDGNGGYVAHALELVHGRQLDATTVTIEEARGWGRGVALFHQAADRIEPAPVLPAWVDIVDEAARSLEDDLRAIGGSIVRGLRDLPNNNGVTGIVHGDPELDNVVWRDGDPVFVDLDDAARSWFAADVCFALRDYAEPARSPDPGREPVSSFLAAYREARPLGEDELSWLPLFAAAHGVVTLARVERALAEPSAEDWPPWAHALRERLEGVAAGLRRALRAAAGGHS